MKKLIIFDLDGTLINTLVDLKNSVNYSLEQKGYPTVTLEHIRRSIGNGVAKLVARCIEGAENNKDYKEVLDIFKKHYSVNYKVETKPYDGITEILIELKKQGYVLAVCTNKIQDVAEELIHLYFGDLFDFVQGDMEGVEKKPHRAMIDRILDKIQIDRKDAFYIGDTEVDEQTAVNSELDYVLVSYGYRTKEEQDRLTPNADVVNTPKELLQYIIEH